MFDNATPASSSHSPHEIRRPATDYQGVSDMEGVHSSPPIKSPLSFKEMIQSNASNPHNVSNEYSDVEEDGEISDDDTAPEEFLNNEKCPAILLSKAEKRKIRKPWQHTLIIKMFAGNVGYMGLMRKLKKKWELKGDLALTDIGHIYFIARFTNESDYNFVLTQGPWLIDDNYLTIRKWVPNFIPDEAPIKVLTA